LRDEAFPEGVQSINISVPPVKAAKTER
jgi:hypothetical protein